jgi:hypothetical protein
MQARTAITGREAFMERDIIISALYRFQEIVDQADVETSTSYQTIEADKRLVRFAVKKYSKTVQWRSSASRFAGSAKRVYP